MAPIPALVPPKPPVPVPPTLAIKDQRPPLAVELLPQEIQGEARRVPEAPPDLNCPLQMLPQKPQVTLARGNKLINFLVDLDATYWGLNLIQDGQLNANRHVFRVISIKYKTCVLPRSTKGHILYPGLLKGISTAICQQKEDLKRWLISSTLCSFHG